MRQQGGWQRSETMQPNYDIQAARKPTLIHAAEQFAAYCRQFSAPTRKSYARYIKAFCQWIASPEVPIDEITKKDIGSYISSTLATYSNNSVNNAVMPAIKSFFAWLADTYDIPNPSISLKHLKAGPNIPRFLTPEEYQAVLKVTKGWHHAIFVFIGNTGLRASEVMNLNKNCLKGRWLTFKGKGGKTRTVPLNDNAMAHVETIINLKKSVSALDNACRAASVKAGIPTFGAHAIRHYFATELLKKQSIHLVSKILGHASTKTTEQIYYHFHYSHLEGLTDCLD